MRSRRRIAQVVLGSLAVSALAASVSAGSGPGAAGYGSIEIVDAATTSTIPNATTQLVQMIPSTFAPGPGIGAADVMVSGALAVTGSADSGPIASVVQTSGGNFGVAATPDASDTFGRRGESSMKLVLAQYN